MGACLSCLGLRSDSDSADRARLLDYDYPHNAYGTWGGNSVPPLDHGMSAEEERRLQTAWDGITQWAGNQIVEIFPSQNRAQHLNLTQTQQYDSDAEETGPNHEPSTNGISEQQHQDILLSMIPGDKSKRSIRIFPASRPTSRSTETTNGHPDGRVKEKASGIFVRMNVNLP